MMLLNARGAVAASLLALTAWSTQAAESLSPLPKMEEGQLANGLHYTLAPLRADKGRVDIRLTVNAGSLNETDSQSGVAHMVEHMVYRGSREWPQGVAAALAEKGWQRGQHYNAMTNHERTQYMLSPPQGVKDLPLALHALSQMMGQALLTQQDLDDERRVILEEWRGKLGVAERMNQQRIAAIRDGSLYPARPVIGTEDSIRHTPASELQAFYQRWYQPSGIRLLVTGDIDAPQVKAEIEKQFGSLPAVPVPVREGDEPVLKAQRRLVRLQDSESGRSQVSLVTRFREDYGFGAAHYRDRLINQMVNTLLSRQLLRQRETLGERVDNLVARKSDISRRTTAFALFADVTPGHHLDGVNALFEERERLLRYGLNETEIEELRQQMLTMAKRMSGKNETRTFADWITVISTSWLNNSPYFDVRTRGAAAVTALETITPADVNGRLHEWLTVPDTLIQFTFPGKTRDALPTKETIAQLESQVKNHTPTPPPAVIVRPAAVLPESAQAGKIVSVKPYPEAHVEEWLLSNGDRVVWLNTPLAKDNVYLTAQSQAGFMSTGLTPWQAQIAAQLVAPAGWDVGTALAWQKAHGVTLNISSQAQQLSISGQAKKAHLGDLMHFYQTLQRTPGIDAAAMKSALMGLSRRQVMESGSNAARREQEVVHLRFGEPAFASPDAALLDAVTPAALLEQWHLTVQAPVTFYLTADMPAEALKTAVKRYLAGLPRGAVLHAPDTLQRSGQREKISAVNVEPKADVTEWRYTHASWSPALAVQVSIARNLMNQHLKKVLRDDARGIYNMRFTSELNDRINRVETEIRFTTSPERARELARLADSAMQSLTITDDAVQAQRAQFQKSEQARAHDLHTQQRRLLLSYTHFNSPIYLSTVNTLAEAITPEAVRSAARLLSEGANRVLYIGLPLETHK